MTTPGDDPRIGTELAGFRIEALVGRGGMGVVYRAEQLRYGRKIALKVLAPELAADEGFRDRFEQEWQTAARLEHPNIVPVYEAGEADGVLYIAMRYVEGIDLNALLGREGRLDPARALGIVGQVGVALDAAHARGLVHRDVKPGNILLSSGSGLEGDHVYLTDFGVAKQTSTRSGLTKTGLFIGTVDYAAPEQIEGKPLDGRADVYALGCVLYQCLTGALPYEKESEVAMLYAHLMEPPPSLAAKRPDLPAALDDVIATALAKAPDDRYSTCRELVAAARTAAGLATVAPSAPRSTAGTVVEGRTVVDVPAARAARERPARPWWRTRAALAVAGLVVIAAAGAGIGIALAGGGGGGGETSAAGPTDVTTVDGSTTDDGQVTDDGETTPVSDDPAVGAIAFSSQRDGDFDIYGMHLDGSGRVRLSNDPGNEGGPRWSPDSSQIAYYGDSDGDFEIYVMNADGSGVTQLTDNDVDDLYPSWSPDGASIAYTETRGEDAEVFVMNADGSGPTQLTENETDDRYPVFSPDGATIAFATAAEAGYDIVTMPSSGGDVTPLTSNDADDDAPDYAPDGATIVFSSDRQGGNYDIWQMDADGANPRRLATASREDAIPRWYEDGSHIVFDSNRDGDFEIYVMNADGTGQTQLTDDQTADYEPDPSLTAVLPEPDGSTQFLTDASAFPTEREAALLTHVPAPTQATCGRESRDDRAGRAIAGVVCTSGPVTVFYDAFRTKAAMDGYYNRLADGVNAARDTGACPSEQTAEGTWTFEGETAGRLLCYTATDGRAVVVWTQDSSKILAFAVRPDANRSALHKWWLGPKSGPIG
jgi:serine/threonine-protein kinase